MIINCGKLIPEDGKLNCENHENHSEKYGYIIIQDAINKVLQTAYHTQKADIF